MTRQPKKPAGFTLVELIVVLGIFSLVFGSSALVYGNLVQKNSLTYQGSQLVQNLRDARTRAVSQLLDSDWGVYFDDTSSPHNYTLFKGSSYAGRDAAYDLTIRLPQSVVISQIDLGGPDELVFSRGDGTPAVSGSLILAGGNTFYSITISSFGLADYSS